MDLAGNLNLLSNIKPGDTISSTGFMLLKHNSYYTACYRRLRGESRLETLGFIKNIITYLLSNTSIIHKFPRESYEKVIVGIQNLKETYQRDQVFCNHLDSVIKDINVVIDYFDNINSTETYQAEIKTAEDV